MARASPALEPPQTILAGATEEAVRDSIGNKIVVGQFLYWKPTGMIVRVTKVSDGGLSMGVSKQLTPASLTVEIEFPIEMEKGAKSDEPVLGNFIRIVDPRAEELLASAMTQ